MGPIEKKILELSKTEGLSEETLMTLTILKNQVKDDERRLANNAYEKGFHDGAEWFKDRVLEYSFVEEHVCEDCQVSLRNNGYL